MNAKKGLLIVDPFGTDTEVMSVYFEDEDGAYVGSRKTIHRLRGALMIDSDNVAWRVKAYKIERVANLKEQHYSVFFYLLGLLADPLRLLSGTVWVRARLTFERVAQWDFPAVKKYVCEQIDKNPDVYVHGAPLRIKRYIAARCNCIDDIAATIMGDPPSTELEWKKFHEAEGY